MFKLAYSLGSVAALIKLGATQLMQALTPAQKAHMERLTEFGATPAQLPPTLARSQQEWRRFSQTQVPELIGASEDYLTSKGKLDPEGMRRSALQRQKLDKWIQAKGPQIMNPEAAATRAPVPGTGTAAGTVAEPLASSGQAARRAANVGTADTALHIVSRKPRPGMQFAKTLLRRFAHV
jgi:hypothetical protein